MIYLSNTRAKNLSLVNSTGTLMGTAGRCRPLGHLNEGAARVFKRGYGNGFLNEDTTRGI